MMSMGTSEDLFAVARKLSNRCNRLEDGGFSESLDKLEEAANQVGKSWSGSWFGYHSCVYYESFAEPPPGARFSQEWGFRDETTVGNWKEYRFGDVIDTIKKFAGNPDITPQEKESKEVEEYFGEAQSAVVSRLYSVLKTKSEDKYISQLLDKAEKGRILYETDVINFLRPSGSIISGDMPAIEKGLQTPPHFSILARVNAIRQPFIACCNLSKIVRMAASHLENEEKESVRDQRIGTKVFIGHGHSAVWKELKDFVQDRLHLPWDEFNRVPVAGVMNIARLSQMLDEAAIAFLILTAEDEQADGTLHARLNVIHEAGLFQGRLGFERAIVLLEDECEEFSNIEGLGQIRFPKGNISAKFEEIRRVLEREGLIEN
jgi:predicted nucleotide-binding protein